jgi:hypothetical protein
MAEEIFNILFQKGFHFFSGIKTDILEYEFSTIYHSSKGSTIGLIIDHNDLYRIRVNLNSERNSSRKTKQETKDFNNRSELIQYLNEI